MTPAEALLQTELFGDLEPQRIESLLPSVRRLEHARGSFVFSEGDRADRLYVMVEGQVKQYRLGRDGAEMIFSLALPGDLFGQVGVFDPLGTRSATAEAMTPAEMLEVPREPLLQFFTANPIAMRRMLELLSALTRTVGQTLTGVAYDEIRSRVALALLRLADDQGRKTGQGLRIPIKLSQANIASMVGASRENVNRAIAALMADGDLSHREGFFVIHRRESLEKLAAPK